MLFKKKDGASKPAGEGAVGPWERELVEKVVTASVTESRRARRWGILFKTLTFVYLFVLLALLVPEEFSQTVATVGKHSALVKVEGIIAPDTKASADNIVSGLRNAFEDKNTRGVILRINSPGGSPVQSAYVYHEIRRLKKLHPKIPVYAVIVDLGASGAYYMAAAADAIYVDRGSIVGSIGVLMNGFGFVDTMKTLGIERRLLTAGDHKGILDPFTPMREEDKRFIKDLLEQLHRQFIAAVREGRGERLKNDPEIFSGLFWSGAESVDLGLADGLGSSGYVARELIGAEDVVDFTHKDDWLKRFSESLGAGMARTLASLSGLSAQPQLR